MRLHQSGDCVVHQVDATLACRQQRKQQRAHDGPEGVVGNQRGDDRDDQEAGEGENAEDVEIFLPSAKKVAHPFDWRRVIVDALNQPRQALGKQVVADMRGPARVTGISIGNMAGLARKVEGELSGLDLACVCVLREFGHTQMVMVAGLVLHLGEDAAGILAKNCIERDERLENSAPLELVQPPHAVEDGRERRLFDRRQIACFEGLFGSIQYVFELS